MIFLFFFETHAFNPFHAFNKLRHATYSHLCRKLDETIEWIEKDTKAKDKKTLAEVRVAVCVCYVTLTLEQLSAWNTVAAP
jgi:hypothetical protein